MTSFSRKVRRGASKNLAKQLKKNAKDIVQEALQAKMESFSRVPDQCTACDKPFDKRNREQVFSWMMQIHEEAGIYNLFCPECYKAKLEEVDDEE